MPRITIGPSWPFTFALVLIVGGILYISIQGMIRLHQLKAAWYFTAIGIAIVLFGLTCFFMTLLGDPGIPKEVYNRKARPNALH